MMPTDDTREQRCDWRRCYDMMRLIVRLEDLFPQLGRHRAASFGALACAVFVAYLLVVLIGAIAHEPWFDEAQSWLLARDASLGDLLLRYLRYEGHPPLWYALLSVPAKLGFPYQTANILSALSMALGVFLFLRLPAIPRLIRIIAPFGFFIAYQYAVVARAYALLLPVLMAIAHLYPDRRRRLWLFTAMLIVLSNISLHGLAMAWAFAALYVIELGIEVRAGHRLTVAESWRHRGAALLFLSATVTLLVVLWPPNDLLIADELSFGRSVKLFGTVLTKSILPMLGTKLWLSVPLAIGFLAWFTRQKMLLTFAAPFLAVQVITSLYSNYWHEGIFYLVWLFALALSFRTPAPAVWRRSVITLCFVVFAQHAVWAARTLSYDIRAQYSGSRMAAQFIKANRFQDRQLHGIGFSTLALQPYFEQPLFDNYQTYGEFTFWDWSESTPFFHPGSTSTPEMMRAAFDREIAKRPELILIGFKFPSDRVYPQWMREFGEYQKIETFHGGLFWKSALIEVEGYELYARVR